jgi:peptide/nickel transport system permease protein
VDIEETGVAVQRPRSQFVLRLSRSLRILRRNPIMAIGLALILFSVFLAVAAPLITTESPRKIAPHDRLQSPSSEHWFGTDHVGRDVFARTVYGSRVSLIVGFAAAGASVLFGAPVGLVSGYFRKLDMLIGRFVDGLMAIPTILLAIALMAILGASMTNVIIALTVVEAPRISRTVRSTVLSLRELTYVDAAVSIGMPTWRILAFHIFPGTIPALTIHATFLVALSVIIEASLSFLGAGTSPDVPSWGNMMAEGKVYFLNGTWIILFPGIALALLVLGVNLAGDGLRDTLDPKLRVGGPES